MSDLDLPAGEEECKRLLKAVRSAGSSPASGGRESAGSGLAKAAGGSASRTRREAYGLEAVVLTDGTRPSLTVRQGFVDLSAPEVGSWDMALGQFSPAIRRVIASVGRVNVPVGPGFAGTCFLVAADVVVTNRHVLEVIADEDSAGVWTLRWPDETVVDSTPRRAPPARPRPHDTAEDSWIRKSLVPTALREIGGGRGGRLVWLVLRFPPGLELPDKTKVRDTLDALYAEVRQHAWARLLLLGLGAVLPPPLDQLVEIDRPRPLTEDDVLDYIERRWPPDEKLASRPLATSLVRSEMARLDPNAETFQLDADYEQMLSGGGS